MNLIRIIGGIMIFGALMFLDSFGFPFNTFEFQLVGGIISGIIIGFEMFFNKRKELEGKE